ncbi:aminoglycoside phosphotransferase family protein [Nonomuraea sp. NN258]|uniref:phosphotransferase enzyme family protein n=1 Tax=Nonomuraea antri TaxID=2730852 RepID=UPI0015687A92|nr:aminoglycoside phosphotransferase family protein [Nonomuraea antri]NRQ32982.1 aminoglycoside phosphotransferase family protein [Nonomuraea antri]
MTETHTARGFSLQDAHTALVAACAEVGLDSRDAVPLRVGENKLFRLTSAPVVVRIARSVDLLADVRKEVAIAAWLEEAGFPGVRLFPDCPQALVHEGRVVTFWQLVESADPAPGFKDLAVMLRELHALPKPVDLVLPLFDPLGRVEDRLDCAPSVPDKDIEFLRRRIKELYAEYNALEFALPAGHIHGDAHKGNLMRRTDGNVILIDFERFAFGPREWDISTAVGIPYQGFRWIEDEAYAQAVDAYGFDIARWPGFHTLRRIRETAMTTWLMQNVNHGSDIRVEFDRRMASLRHDVLPRAWRPF